LKAVGSTIKYSEYPGVGHDAWTMTFANEEVIDWLFTFKTEAPGAAGSSGMGGGGNGSGSGGSGGGAAGGSSAGAGMGGASSAGNGTGGSAAGSASGGSAGSSPGGDVSAPAGASGNGPFAVEPTNGDSSCSFRPQSANDQHCTSGLLLGGCAALVLSRRRRTRAAA